MSTALTPDFNNAYAKVQTNFTQVKELTFDFGSASDAIDNLNFILSAGPGGSLTPVPVPANLPLLLAGIGAFRFMARRKPRA